MGLNNANLIGDDFYTLVLSKLKHILVNGFYSMDEVRYEYTWDGKMSKDENLICVRKEDAALRYFQDIGLFDGARLENEFRSQELQARRVNPDTRVWAIWDEVDPAYREYEWIVEIYSINHEKFSVQLGKFGLVDTGTKLEYKVSVPMVTSVIPLPPVSKKITESFTVHESNLISHDGRLIELEPQVSTIIALIMERSVSGQYTPLTTIIDQCLSEEYLSKAEKSSDEQLVYKYIRRCVSDARSSFRAITQSDKNKDFFPNKPNVGYIFEP